MSIWRHSHYDANENKFYLEGIQDVEPILDNNKALANEGQKADAFHHVGEIPNVIVERWLNEEYERGNTSLRMGSEEFQKLCISKLRSSEWQWLRTTNKRF
jgi:hypothetical protein